MEKFLSTRKPPRGLAAWWDMLKTTWREFSDDHAERIGAALAYYTVFSVAPIVVIAVVVAGAVFGEDAARGEMSRQLVGLLGPTAARGVEDIVNHTTRSGGGTVASIVGVATLLLGATSVFVQLQSALNAMWDVKPERGKGLLGMLRSRALGFTMVVALGFLLLVSLVMSALLSGVGGLLEQWLDVPAVALQLANQGISLAVVTLLFALVYKFLPDAKIAWGDVWVGAAATAAMFTLGKFAIGTYLGNSSVASAYGAAGSLVVLLVWVYYSAQIVLFGAEFTQVYARRRGSQRFLRPLHPFTRKGGERS
ncbi:MAG: YihY/virulence factor BrkB family protein [Myxococcota bacterium]